MQKNITFVFSAVDFVLPGKIVSRIALESESKAFYLLKSAAINL